MTFTIKNDYEGYFEQLSRKIVQLCPNPWFTTVEVSAGPYRSEALSIGKVDNNTVSLDFYSAIRRGFGSLSLRDIQEAANYLAEIDHRGHEIKEG